MSLKENILGEMINTTQGGVIYSINFGPLIKTLGSYFCTAIGYYSHLSIIRNILLAIVIILNILPQIKQINTLNLNKYDYILVINT